MRILVTGGPVHAYLDAVKLITNRFRGGLMVELVQQLAWLNAEVVYLTTKDAIQPAHAGDTELFGRISVAHHDGIHDYHKKVLEIAPHMDGVVLGAAVANLIPKNPIKGKFPSHDYKPGDTIPIEFTIAPRIIDDVKKVAPNTKLFGFKLLAGVSHDELIRAAYGIVLEAKATAVFANQTDDLTKKFIVTRERGVLPQNKDDLAAFIIDAVQDEYYTTRPVSEMPYDYVAPVPAVHRVFDELVAKYRHEFVQTPEGYTFGTIAVANPYGGFLTTGRGKNELDDRAIVAGVDHAKRVVYVGDDRKATLNAPLLDRIFTANHGRCTAIIHMHKMLDGYSIPMLPYAPAGTVRDVERDLPIIGISDNERRFNIAGHGCFILLRT